jgi:hypothetical protein
MARRGFGDETWRLAETGDAAGLARVAALIHDGDDGEYDGRRAAAFRLALERRTQEALAELNEGWSDDWPPPSAYALDVARIHFLAGDTTRCLAAIELELRGLSRWDGVGALVVAAVRRDPRRWRTALGLVLRAERGPRKLRGALAVVRARLARRPHAALAAPTPES